MLSVYIRFSNPSRVIAVKIIILQLSAYPPLCAPLFPVLKSFGEYATIILKKSAMIMREVIRGVQI